MMRVMSSVGSPTDVSTITMVTSPACGIPAAPMLAAVAVMLVEKSGELISDIHVKQAETLNDFFFSVWTCADQP